MVLTIGDRGEIMSENTYESAVNTLTSKVTTATNTAIKSVFDAIIKFSAVEFEKRKSDEYTETHFQQDGGLWAKMITLAANKNRANAAICRPVGSLVRAGVRTAESCDKLIEAYGTRSSLADNAMRLGTVFSFIKSMRQAGLFPDSKVVSDATLTTAVTNALIQKENADLTIAAVIRQHVEGQSRFNIDDLKGLDKLRGALKTWKASAALAKAQGRIEKISEYEPMTWDEVFPKAQAATAGQEQLAA